MKKVLFVVVAIHRGVNGSLHVDAKKAFTEKAKALELAQNMNDMTDEEWAFVSTVDVINGD